MVCCWCQRARLREATFFFNNMLGRIAGGQGDDATLHTPGVQHVCKGDCVMGPWSMEGFVGKIIFRTFYSGEGCTGVA